MKTTVYFTDFERAFRDYDRSENFSHLGLCTLFDYLEELEEETGEETELDVIAICRDFTEYESLEAFRADYGDCYKSIEDIDRNTTVIVIEGTSRFIVGVI